MNVRIVAGDDLPNGHDWVAIEVDGEVHLCVGDGPDFLTTLREAWEATVRLNLVAA